MTNWIELTGKKTIHNGKEYYATQYSRDVLNDLCGKHCGDPCVYVERKETVHDLNYKNPFSADDSCFFDDDSIASNGCVLKNVTLKNGASINGDVSVYDSELDNAEIETEPQHSKVTARIFSDAKIVGRAKSKLTILIKGKNTTVYVSDTEIVQNEFSEKEKLAEDISFGPISVVSVVRGKLEILNSKITATRQSIAVKGSNVSIQNCEITNSSICVSNFDKESEFIDSKINANFSGHGFFVCNSTIAGSFFVDSCANGLVINDSVFSGEPIVGVHGKELRFWKTKTSGKINVTKKITSKFNSSFDCCDILDDTQIVTSGIDSWLPTFKNTTFKENCLIDDAVIKGSTISGHAFVFEVSLDNCKIGGDAIVGAEIDNTRLPAELASRISLNNKEINSILDFYIIKAAKNYYFAFLGNEAYVINEKVCVNKCNFKRLCDDAARDAVSKEDFPLSDMSTDVYDTMDNVFTNSKEKVCNILKDDPDKSKRENLLNNLVDCTILGALLLFIWFSDNICNVDYSKLEEIKKYIDKNSLYDFSKKKMFGLSSAFTIVPMLVIEKPFAISDWFENNKKVEGFVF